VDVTGRFPAQVKRGVGFVFQLLPQRFKHIDGAREEGQQHVVVCGLRIRKAEPKEELAPARRRACSGWCSSNPSAGNATGSQLSGGQRAEGMALGGVRWPQKTARVLLLDEGPFGALEAKGCGGGACARGSGLQGTRVRSRTIFRDGRRREGDGELSDPEFVADQEGRVEQSGTARRGRYERPETTSS